MKKRILTLFISVVFVFAGAVPSYAAYETGIDAFNYGDYAIPAYDGDTYEEVNSNQPVFSEEELASEEFESYGDLDELGRCTECEAHLDAGLMPAYKRGSIQSVKPTGWINNNYECVSGGWLYNRCHLIGFQLTGIDCENAKKELAPRDLITGTKQLNVGSGNTGMVKFENEVANYIRTGGEVLYRVTPVFWNDDLVARGVLMEGQSVEEGVPTEDVEFCVFCYNVQPGISIDYATGENKLTEIEPEPEPEPEPDPAPPTIHKPYTVKISSATANNICYKTKTGTKYHITRSCVKNPIKTTITSAKRKGYTPCKKCGSKRWITVTYKRPSYAKGYEIAYRAKSQSKYTTIKTTSLSRKITGLKKNTTYYIKVRAYNKYGTTIRYGNYSSVKIVKTK